jgi:hypothetical protein
MPGKTRSAIPVLLLALWNRGVLGSTEPQGQPIATFGIGCASLADKGRSAIFLTLFPSRNMLIVQGDRDENAARDRGHLPPEWMLLCR